MREQSAVKAKRKREKKNNCNFYSRKNNFRKNYNKQGKKQKH